MTFFVKNYSKDGNKDYFIAFDVKYGGQLRKLNNHLTIFSRKNENFKKSETCRQHIY